ncbi:TetR/AcrR family transcriptional regulator [Micromonospora sp. ALFpr18c]|uniref:TetR/AcrR family transcriptional regulator n=1 Tax=unclassified Micromonospora TaxID=2617518 RepID=UPI00124AFE0D|nr:MULTISPECIES: TetR/AcrR family transcriptional regulator [unclassified Micromonospora]KAB1940994.1 TetR/AcrR family transcriptional regulator [Micromonospora sp. ALFpr18c]MDG4757553.1 TetR/AcrR family transcriptional regulator [Micromonospora sp. WMMD710]
METVEVPGRVDGRTARAERTRAAIVEAHLALISEGDLRPTGERIAERAGISLRTLWTNFKDMETLFEASGAEVLRQQDAAYRPIAPGLPLVKRVDAYCRQRARLLQLIAPSARAAQMREPVSDQLHRNRLKHIDRVREEVEQLFAAELARAGRGRDQLLNALVVASTWSSWSMLRDGLGLGVDPARAVMARTVGALLAEVSAD